jgi:hypothetical protein
MNKFFKNPLVEGYKRYCGDILDPRTEDAEKKLFQRIFHHLNKNDINKAMIFHQKWLSDKVLGPPLGDDEGYVSVWSKGNVEFEPISQEAKNKVNKLTQKFIKKYGL